MADNLVTLPDVTQVIDNRFLLEPLGGPGHPQSYLDRYPEEVYNTSIDSRLVKFIYSFMGPAGIGWLRKNYLQARLMIEELGLEAFDLESFYGDPLKFGRIVEEVYSDDPNGLISREAWQRIKARDARYRNRAIDFIGGARMGNTPMGMHLVARSGLGHEVEIVENYRWLYDQYSDDPLGLTYYGKTRSTEEMVVLPRREVPRSEAQIIRIDGSPTGGTFRLFFPMGNEVSNTTGDIPYNADSYVIQQHLEALATIAPGDIRVTGGPLPNTPIRVEFQGNLSARDLPELVPTSSFVGGTVPLTLVLTDVGGVDSLDEIVNIPPRDVRYLQSALDRIKPVTAIPTVGQASGLRHHQVWNALDSSSRFTEVVRYVTGANGVPWPTRGGFHWIEANVEHEGRRPRTDISQHYVGFHRPSRLNASSTHMGRFAPHQSMLFPFLYMHNALHGNDPAHVCLADHAAAHDPEPLTMTGSAENGEQAFVNGIYPVDYRQLPGVTAPEPYVDEFWSSTESSDPEESLVIDLGSIKAVNFLSFELSRKPVNISVEYDLLDQGGTQAWFPVTLHPRKPSITAASFDPQATNPWLSVTINFVDRKAEMIFTRYIRISFARRNDPGSPFVSPDGVTQLPWSIDVRNLRVGRNVA